MSKAKFQNKFTAHQTEPAPSAPAPKAGLPMTPPPTLPAHQYPTTPVTPPPAPAGVPTQTPAAQVEEPILIQQNNPVGAELEDIMSEDPLNRDKDKPNTKYQDVDFA